MRIKNKTGLEWLTLPFLLKSNARRYPDKEAVVDLTYNKKYTYHEAALRSNRVANALTNLGIKDGDKVAYLCLSTEESFHLVFGATAIGAVLVPVNFRLTADQIVSQVNHCNAKTIVCQDKLCKVIETRRHDMPGVKNYIGFGKDVRSDWLKFEDLVTRASDKEPDYEVKYNDLASISYTSGTTGEPKGCMRSHSSWVGYALSFILLQGYGPQSKIWTLMDMVHIGGFMATFSAMLVGGTIYYTEVFDPKKSWEVINQEKITDIIPIVIGINYWLDMPDRPAYDMSHVQRVWWGAQPPYSRWVAGKKLFPNAVHNWSFGATEGWFTKIEDAELTNVKPDEWEGLGVGRILEGGAMFGHELMVTDLDGVAAVPDGQYGLIWARGMAAIDGFYKSKELEKTSVKSGGWVNAGDAGYIEPKTKWLYFVDRVKDVVRSGGENVATGDVERVLMRNPKIQACAVIGTPHDKLGETVTAIIQLKAGEQMTADEVVSFCKDKLSGPQMPRRIEFMTTIPVVGFKALVDKKALRAEFTKKYHL